jgi:hypothetical protein
MNQHADSRKQNVVPFMVKPLIDQSAKRKSRIQKAAYARQNCGDPTTPARPFHAEFGSVLMPQDMLSQTSEPTAAAPGLPFNAIALANAACRVGVPAARRSHSDELSSRPRLAS